ncbi:hypothetical protein D3C81_1289230 [compost metagenome]
MVVPRPAAQATEALVEGKSRSAHAPRSCLVAVVHVAVAIEKPQRGGLAVQQQVPVAHSQVQALHALGQPPGSGEMQGDALEQGLVLAIRQLGIRVGQQREKGVASVGFVQLDAGDMAQAIGVLVFLVIGAAADGLQAVILEVVIPVAHRPLRHEQVAGVEAAVVLVVGLDDGAVVGTDAGNLDEVVLPLLDHQSTLLAARGLQQPVEQLRPAAFVDYAFVAERNQFVVELLLVGRGHRRTSLFWTRDLTGGGLMPPYGSLTRATQCRRSERAISGPRRARIALV